METGDKKCIGEYTIEKLQEGLYAIDDDGDSSFYVVEGRQRAAVIDTGMGETSIVPVVKSLTKLPCVLLLTHGHGDHIRYAPDFPKRYMCSRDIPLVGYFAKRMGLPETMGELAFQSIEPGDMIELGGAAIEAVAMAGHTPGSLGFYCEDKRVLFTGDAIGSGSGVFMQLPGCLDIGSYKESLEGFVSWALSRNIGREEIFLSGHRRQRYGFPGMNRDNPVTLALAEDMIVLCEKLLSGEIHGTSEAALLHMGDEFPRTASFGKADIVYLESSLKAPE